ncbi:MAG: DinB family protein [Reyranellales bacterium]
MSELWAQYARYNRRANELLYAACARLSGADYRRETGAFFGSVHGTLNHLLLGDTIWMTRFEGGTHPSTGLNAILFEQFDALHAARQAMDRRIECFFADLPSGFDRGSVRYVNNSGFDTEDPWLVILPHFFNHQTHHRGQVHTLLSQLGHDPPVLDLHRVLRPDPQEPVLETSAGSAR